MGKSFAYSWTRLEKWRQCPKQYYHVFVAKDVPQESTDAMTWGTSFHEAVSKYIDNGKPLPDSMNAFRDLPDQLRTQKLNGSRVTTELQLAMDAEFQPTEWFGRNTWLRVIVDVLVLPPVKRQGERAAIAIDWKTGNKVKPENEQLALNAAVVFAHHEDVDVVHTSYQWIAKKQDTLVTFSREGMVPFWAGLLPEVKRFEQASINMTFPPNPATGNCDTYCPVKECPYYRKNRR